MSERICVELFAGTGSWSAGWLALGGRAVLFDIEHHPWHGPVPEGAELVLQDVLTLHGSQFRNASLILASPPCQNYSYLAMPWSRSKSNNSQKAKALRRKWETEGPDNRLFDACFRIQREASEAAGHHIPMVVENVRGAQPWVGRAAWSHGSYYLWGDVPALMPFGGRKRMKFPADCGPRLWKDRDVPRLNDGENDHRKNDSGSWFGEQRADPRDVRKDNTGAYVARDGTKIGGDWSSDPNSTCRKHGSRSQARKAASARIAMIPRPLSDWIARTYWPAEGAGNGTR